MIHVHILSWTLGTESTRRAARQAMMKPQRENSRPALRLFAGKIAADSTVRRRLDGGLVAKMTLRVDFANARRC